MVRNSRGSALIEALVASLLLAVLVLFVFSALGLYYKQSYYNQNMSNMNLIAIQGIEKVKSQGYSIAKEGSTVSFCDTQGKVVDINSASYKITTNITSSSLEYRPDGTVAPGNNATRMVNVMVSDLNSDQSLEQSTMLVKGGI